MDATARIEQTLVNALSRGHVAGCPPGLAAAVRHAVFPGGARIRPRLCLAVAQACGARDPDVADAAAASIELLHCASLVHDDLPCFDDAPLRRGRPSVHRAYGERLAVLAGDALIVLAFEVLARGTGRAPLRLAPLLNIIARAVGMPNGIVAGQAWECEPRVLLSEYQQEKTGALFAAATTAGAEAAGVPSGAWRELGERLGEAFQVADDIRDVVCDEDEIGKPVGRDEALHRPSAARELGIVGACQRFEHLMALALQSIPACPGGSELHAAIAREGLRILPPEAIRRAA